MMMEHDLVLKSVNGSDAKWDFRGVVLLDDRLVVGSASELVA